MIRNLLVNFFEIVLLFLLGTTVSLCYGCISGCRCSNFDLKTLKCVEAGFDQFPPGIGRDTQFLRFKGNQIEEIAANLSSIVPNLEKLDMQNNKLKLLPERTFSDLKALNLVLLNNNGITELGNDLFQGNEADRLLIALYGNKITTIQPFAFRGVIADLTLRLQQNSLTELHKDTFAGLRNIQHLNLADNSIERIDPDLFRDMRRMLLLDLDGNNLTSLHVNTFKNVESVENLNLAQNQIKSLPEQLFQHNKALLKLDLRQNKFEELPINLHFPSKLQSILLQGNPLSCDCALKRQIENTTVKAKFEDLDQVVCANDPEKATVSEYLAALNCVTTTTTTTTTLPPPPSTATTNATARPGEIDENSTTTNKRPITTITKVTVTHMTVDKTSRDGNSGPIVVGCLVGLLVLIVFAGVFFYLFRRKISEKCITVNYSLRRKKLPRSENADDFKYHDAAGWTGASTAMLKKTEGIV